MVGPRGVLVCVAAVSSALLAPAEVRARAAAFTVTLEYAVGSGCPDAENFKAVVTTRLGYDPFNESAADHVLVRIASRDGSLDGRIEWRDSSGKWTGDQSFPLVSSDCLRLVRAMGFALAVQIQLLAKTGPARDLDVGTRAGSGPPAEAPTPPATPRPAGVTTVPDGPTIVPGATTTAPSPTRGPRPVFAMGAGPSIGFGMSSTPVLLGRLFGALAWQHVSVELAAAVSLPATTRRADGAGFSQQHLLVSAASCAIVTRWNVCLVANAGEVRMVGEDIDHPTSAEAPVFETGARVAVIQRFGRRVFLDAHVDGLVILTRWTARLDQVPVWTAPRFAAAIGIDTGVRFP